MVEISLYIVVFTVTVHRTGYKSMTYVDLFFLLLIGDCGVWLVGASWPQFLTVNGCLDVQ